MMLTNEKRRLWATAFVVRGIPSCWAEYDDVKCPRRDEVVALYREWSKGEWDNVPGVTPVGCL